MGRCKMCGFRIRGKDHENGVHHKSKQRPDPRRKQKVSKTNTPEMAKSKTKI